jgi:MtrB/PioB family decaheme-associated outer membrane protein
MITALPLSEVRAADQAVAFIAPPDLGWYNYGGFEAGARYYLERPPSGYGRAAPPDNWLTPKNTDSIAKFEEYGKTPYGPFLDWINLQTGSNDGRYAFDMWGRSVGLNNQSYSLDAAVVGYHYLSLGWEQIPHLISTSAKNIFTGVGTTHLSVSDPVQAQLQAQLPNAAAVSAAGATARANIENIINSNVSPLELSTRRDRGSVAYQYTPNDEWTFQADYSNEHRTGLRPLAMSWGFSTTALNPRPTNVVETPAPINDRTQNVNAGGEYFGTTFFGTKWNTNVRYVGSFYEDTNKVFTVENPFCLTCSDTSTAGSRVGPNILQMPMQPDNQANGVVWNTGIDLPWYRSRFSSTFQYNRMTQNDPFPNQATNGVVVAPITTINGVPVTSLNGKVNTILWYNVLTAHLTNELKLVVKERHYDINNETPMLQTTNWNWGDSGLQTGIRRSLPISYIKDNASTELNYRPARWLNVGGGWFWERWDRQLRDVNVTKENTGKVYADVTAAEGVLWRGSYLYAKRRYDEYNTEDFVDNAAGLYSEVASNMRRFDIANRNRHKAETAFEFALGPYATLTPNAGLRRDDYPDTVWNTQGLLWDHSWNAGIELAAMIQPTLKVMVAYVYEDRRLLITGGTGGANFNTGSLLTGCSTNAAINPDAIIGTACTWGSDIRQRSNTVMFAADWKVVPSLFDLRFEFLYTRSKEQNTTAGCTAPPLIGTTAVGTNCDGLNTTGTTPPVLIDPALVYYGQYPDEINTFKRFNVIGRYYVDPVLVRQMGWVGDVTLKLRYTWERNKASNWATDNMTPYQPTPDTTELTGANRSYFLAPFNPNYNAHLIAAAVAMKW